MRVMKLIIALVLSLVSFAAYATDVQISCKAPTTYTDNTAIPSGTAITYKVYGAKAGATKQLLDTKSSCSFTRTNVDPGTQEYYVTATVAGTESNPSSTASIVVPNPTPKPPTGITVTIAVTIGTP